MKFDPRSPRAWSVFVLTYISMFLAFVAGTISRRRPPSRPRIVLYGHTYAGNIKALVDHAPPGKLERWDVTFLYLDSRRYRDHSTAGVRPLLATNPRHMLAVVRADVVVTTHGPGVLAPLLKGVRSLPFVDVWHGVGYHRRDTYLRKTKDYARVFMPSEWSSDFCGSLGLHPDRSAVTGHGLWDSVTAPYDDQTIRQRYELPSGRAATVLVAPTWTNAALGVQSPIFAGTWEEALDRLDAWAAEHDTLVVFRSHLNAGEGTSARRRNVVNRPFTRFPVTVDFLQVADVVVTDWSSIGVDYLPLDRPLVYLDTPPPFEVGHLGLEDRPGAVVSSVDGLIEALTLAVEDPAAHRDRYRSVIDQVRHKACGSMADGKVVERYWEELERFVDR